MGELSPFVYWAQTESHVSLRVDLKNAESPKVDLNEDQLIFTSVGLGAKGRNEYSFALEFFLKVDPKISQYRLMDREIEFNLKKNSEQWWPRLTAENKKPAWLKTDFDKFKSEDDDEVEQTDINEQMKQLFDPKKEEEMQEEAYRKVYMFMYNLFMFGGFLAVVIMMLVYALKDGSDGINSMYSNVGGLFMFFQFFQLFEIGFALVGWTKTSVKFPVFQICGRLIIYFVMIMPEPRLHTSSIVFYLILVWCSAEIGRYPYYILKIFDLEVNFVTWLRYTLWIPLYPAGFFCEGYVIFKNIPYFEETKRFCYHLPNALNWSFDMPSIMRFYLLFLCFPLMFLMMSNMYLQRRHKLSTGIFKKQKEE